VTFRATEVEEEGLPAARGYTQGRVRAREKQRHDSIEGATAPKVLAAKTGAHM
jgi:hypothetical protein